MSAGGFAAPLLCVAAVTAALAVPRSSVHGPEPGHTGGFGEPTCRACHLDGSERPDATVTIAGLPASWTPGHSYRITVVVSGAGIRRGGFQLAARFASGQHAGRQAGTLSGDPRSVAVTAAGDVAYIQHVLESTAVTVAGEIRWDLLWTAPAGAASSVVFHVAGNAATDDNSELGDRIVTSAVTVPVAQR